MKELVIHTDAGNLDLTPATPDELKHIAAEWPMGVILNRAEAGPNGLVFQIGKEEAYGVNLQPPDTDEPTAQALYFNNLALIAAALPFYLEHGHRGILLPCTYYKKKSDGRFESGIAFFMSPRLVSTTPAPTKAQGPGLPVRRVQGNRAPCDPFPWLGAQPPTRLPQHPRALPAHQCRA